jgi:integrase
VYNLLNYWPFVLILARHDATVRAIRRRLCGGHSADTDRHPMAQKLTDKIVAALPCPQSGNRVTYDSEVRGFGIRVTAKGARSFVLNYRSPASGRERRYTIGQFPPWKTAAARTEAGELRKRIDRQEDPLEQIKTIRAAPTVGELCQRFMEEHLPKKRPATQRDYRRIISNEVSPALKHMKVAGVTFENVDALHRAITKRGAPYTANRTAAVLSKMFGLAIKWGYCPANPARGIERNPEEKRHRYLSSAELTRFTDALSTHRDRMAADILRILLLTGARRGEVQAMRWADLDLESGTWTKPASTTKQKALHRVPLSAPVRQHLAKLYAEAKPGAEFVFPGAHGGHRVEIKHNWAAICKAAGISGARIHDLRHTYASLLVNGGASLPLIGALLGHSQPQTTARYAHLFDDPQRRATEGVGALLTEASSGEVVRFRRGRAP